MAGAIVTTVVLTGIEAFHLVVKISEPWSFGLSAGKEGAITLLESIALGIIQGITEFLPISSSGHLVLSQRLLGLREPQVLFDIALHGGTLMAVILVFWGDIAAIFRTLFDWLKGRIRGESYPLIHRQPHGPLAIWIGVATVPTGLIGLALADRVELLFTSSAVVGGGLLVTGTILWSTFYWKNSERRAADMGVWDAVWVGVAQGIAVIPGISRSGATVSTSLFRGLEREFAARFSFLLMIPATVLALVLQLTSPQGGEGIPLTVVLIGTLVAFLSGYASLRFLMGIIRRGKFYRFAYYCWGLGGMSLILSLTG